MAEANGVLRTIAWRDLFPWWVLFRVFRLSISPPVLVLATAAMLLTPLGWRFGEFVFLPRDLRDAQSPSEMASGASPSFPALARYLSKVATDEPAQRELANPWKSDHLLEQPIDTLWRTSVARSRHVYYRFVAPFRALLTPGQSLTRYAYLLFGGLWTLLIWSFFGGAITRIAAVRFGPEQRIGLREALFYSGRRIASYFVAPLFPLLVVVAIVIVSLPLGLLMRLDAGVLAGGVLWILVILAGLLMAMLLLGLALGWPLMWPTISSEESGDVFEATQRCYSYTFDRPLNYLLYALLATVLGATGWIVVLTFSEAVIDLGFWALAWGAGEQRMQLVRQASLVETEASGTLAAGQFLIRHTCGLVRCVASSYLYAYFLCAASAIYLLLRMDVDQTEMDEVFVEDDQERFGLPPLQTDGAGVPGMATGSELPVGPQPPDEAPDETAGKRGGSDQSADASSPK